ncbi:extracellular solute-binding protein [Nonomuraea sp. NPDC052265]|uniref:extracellular solute-binding protein n=1 Tax=Nonomuraea sp. NPDC052265 TaxID=3364374 RepID=UPI0037CA7009
MTWNHTRGVDSIEAATAAFLKDRDDLTVEWEARSLQEFEDTSITELAARYDLVAIDHPHVGVAAATGALVDLHTLLPAGVIDEQRANSVGPSLRSYELDGALWALPMDAAAQVAAHRPDLLPIEPPRDLDAAISLMGEVRAQVPANPTHLWSTLLSLCQHVAGDVSSGASGRPAWWPDSGIDAGVAAGALALLRTLLAVADPVSLARDPIQTLDAMAGGEPIAYVPFVFGYSNYARTGYRPHLIRFTDSPVRHGTMLGGVGLAVSARCADPAAAAELAGWVVSRQCQTGVFTTAGGQPGHRAAWTDDELNRLTHGFFADTLTTLDRAFVRGRTPGYPLFQQRAGETLHRLITSGAGDKEILSAIEDLWRAS